MKAATLYFYLLFATAPLFAQTQFPFPTDFAEWDYTLVYGVLGPTDRYESYRDFMTGDTVHFNNHIYYEVFTQHMCTCVCTSPSGDWQSTNNPAYRLGGVREENGKVYFTRFGGTGNSYFSPVYDTLLYDFTVQPGDTIPYDGGPLVVEAVTQEPNGRKVIRLAGLPQKYWKEGIGAFGILRTNYQWYHLTSCFNPVAPCITYPCALVNTQEPDPLAISVQPTTTRDLTTLLVDPALGAYHYQIWNTNGQLQAQSEKITGNHNISLNNYPPGLYLLRVFLKDGHQTGLRIVRMD